MQPPCGPPPPYSSQGYSTAYPQASPQPPMRYPAQYAQPYPPQPAMAYTNVGAVPYPLSQPIGHGPTPVQGCQFDGGARFSPQCPPTIPPPPPGYAPNAAQQLAQAGYNIQVRQSGHNKTGGWTFW
ncbi:hypothetical protein CRM22_007557 [Opisthorchis felineus]|uniref:DAZ-associated protein 2 n=1 Tax=Opisthorchis felineus TaxID=147828 RepID=A0A4S2LM88_OPIFE|nr:hypothetical protein CRM22_007557 [Opisthorchis felineus]